jgi:hypothetical protein
MSTQGHSLWNSRDLRRSTWYQNVLSVPISYLSPQIWNCANLSVEFYGRRTWTLSLREEPTARISGEKINEVSVLTQTGVATACGENYKTTTFTFLPFT